MKRNYRFYGFNGILYGMKDLAAKAANFYRSVKSATKLLNCISSQKILKICIICS